MAGGSPFWAHALFPTIISVAQHHRHTLSQTGGVGGVARTTLCPLMSGPRWHRSMQQHTCGTLGGAREVGTRAGVLASRVRPEVETKTRSRHPNSMRPAGRGGGAEEAAPHSMGQVRRAERQGGRQTRGADCVWEQGIPLPQ